MVDMAKNIFWASVGLIAGVICTKMYLEKKYEKISQDEIESVKQMYAKKEFRKNDENKIQEEYEDLISNLNYSGSNERRSERMMEERPYVISPEEFGEFEDYEKISLTYYSGNKILADENDEPVEDVDEIVGIDSLDRFGEYEEDSVFVRNDRLKCDYEILMDSRAYPGWTEV